MAMHEQTPDQTTPTRPTPEQATEAQAYFARPEIVDIARNAIRHELGEKGVRHFETILAVAQAPTDQEVADVYAREAYLSDGDGHRIAIDAIRSVPESSAAITARVVRRFFGSVKP